MALGVEEDDAKERIRSQTQEWVYRLMNDPEYFEKWRYTDTINDYNSIIEEFEKLYEQTPPTATQQYARARILSGMKQSKRELAKTQAEYKIFKKYKTRTAISK
jgi:ElaB/YqjD/DUF883 family membrane-anchored ribosome-binding protein